MKRLKLTKQLSYLVLILKQAVHLVLLKKEIIRLYRRV